MDDLCNNYMSIKLLPNKETKKEGLELSIALLFLNKAAKKIMLSFEKNEKE